MLQNLNLYMTSSYSGQLKIAKCCDKYLYMYINMFNVYIYIYICILLKVYVDI